ncbi:jg3363 [Pararge aegeria aegeria]|uniref:Jg3363 protein n=1 Tax=Pararge aegeria aegeria TaxID=348720 RepID=A0A8S4RQM4_9NEOP|nr:jg3363 [Pararge aegeria aegeria]
MELAHLHIIRALHTMPLEGRPLIRKLLLQSDTETLLLRILTACSRYKTVTHYFARRSSVIKRAPTFNDKEDDVADEKGTALGHLDCV